MWALATAGLVAALLLVPASGHADDRPPPSGERFTLVEHVRVVGSCVEDHGGEPAKYTGFIDRWHDVRKNRDLLHGSVTNFDRLATDQLAGNRVVLRSR